MVSWLACACGSSSQGAGAALYQHVLKTKDSFCLSVPVSSASFNIHSVGIVMISYFGCYTLSGGSDGTTKGTSKELNCAPCVAWHVMQKRW